jgi:hypothetical protein
MFAVSSGMSEYHTFMSEYHTVMCRAKLLLCGGPRAAVSACSVGGPFEGAAAPGAPMRGTAATLAKIGGLVSRSRRFRSSCQLTPSTNNIRDPRLCQPEPAQDYKSNPTRSAFPTRFDLLIWLTAARRALAFVRTRIESDGRLSHCFCNGLKTSTAILDDCASRARAALVLYEATNDTAYTAAVERGPRTADRAYCGYLLTAEDGEGPSTRIKNAGDRHCPPVTIRCWARWLAETCLREVGLSTQGRGDGGGVQGPGPQRRGARGAAR